MKQIISHPATLAVAIVFVVLFGFAPLLTALEAWHCWWRPHVFVCQ